MFKFDVYQLLLIRKSLKILLVICYYIRHSLNIEIIRKLHLTVQKAAGCCMYPCDLISSVA